MAGYKDQVQLLIQVIPEVEKLEVNQDIRGVIGSLNPMILCQRAQEEFDAFNSIQGVPVGQLYGGKICAALDRQHPRDLFDVHYMLEHEGGANSGGARKEYKLPLFLKRFHLFFDE